MRQIVFISLAAQRFSDIALVDLWEKAARNNLAAGIRGLMLFDGSRFMQAIEGDQSSVYSLMHRIWIDPRHSRITLLADQIISAPHFAFRTMGLAQTCDDDKDGAFLSRVMAEVDGVDDPHMLAAFIGFASLSKRGAG